MSERQWPERACIQFKYCLAPSTINTYNKYISDFTTMCYECSTDVSDEPTLIKYLCHIADNSERPKSALNCARAALSHMFIGLKCQNPLNTFWINHFITALIKSGTKNVRPKSNVIPVSVLRNMFYEWPDNFRLDVKRLRMKCISLLALSLMLRPSDISPKGLLYSNNGVIEKMIFSREHVSFSTSQDGAINGAQISFHGIKNDTLRDGFIVKLPVSSDPKLCPVKTLHWYMNCTSSQTPKNNPVFISLRRPFKELSAQAVASVLNDTLRLAGLYPSYTAKDFRPTGATIQVKEGVNPKTVMKVGCWKTDTVFFDHYVHDETPTDFSDNVLFY